MGNIIRATTPTIIYKFKNVTVTDITSAFLSVKKDDGTVLEKDLSDAIVSAQEKSIMWTLSQEETLRMAGKVSVMVNWKTSGGVRGASAKTTLKIDDNYKDEVI